VTCTAVAAIGFAVLGAMFGACAGFLLAGLFVLGQDREARLPSPAPTDGAGASLLELSEPPRLSKDPPGPKELRH
jgi:hypothetical protein